MESTSNTWWKSRASGQEYPKAQAGFPRHCTVICSGTDPRAVPSTAVTVKLYWPAFVGTPLSNPPGSRVSPGGSVPCVTAQVGPGEKLDTRSCRYVIPTAPFGNAE